MPKVPVHTVDMPFPKTMRDIRMVRNYSDYSYPDLVEWMEHKLKEALILADQINTKKTLRIGWLIQAAIDEYQNQHKEADQSIKQMRSLR